MSARLLGLTLLITAGTGCAMCDCVADLVQVTVVDATDQATTWTSFTVVDAEGTTTASDTCPEGSACRTAFVPMDGPEGTYTVQIDGPAGSATFTVELDRPRKVVGRCCSDVFSERVEVTLEPTE